MPNVNLIDGHIDYPIMTNEKVIEMIDEYLSEPNSIHRDWIQALIICKQALVENERQKAEIERLNKEVERLKEFEYMYNSLLK